MYRYVISHQNKYNYYDNNKPCYSIINHVNYELL